MDPSIVKLLKEDEDESMHSGADVAAFTAALNRDIEGHPSSPQRSDSGSSNINPMWQQSSHDMNNNHTVHDIKNMEHQMQCSSEMNVNQYAPGTESGQQMANAPNTQSEHLLQHNQAQEKSQEINLEQQHPFQLSQSSSMPMSGMGSSQVHELGKMPNPSNEAQFSNIQKFSSQPAPSSEQAYNPANRSRQIPFGTLLPSILPELDKDRAMQLQTLYNKLRKDEVAKEDFVRLMRGMVGDHMLKVAVMKTQTKMAREPQPRPSQMELHQQNQLQRQHPLIRPRADDPYTFAHRQNAPLDHAMSQTVDNNSQSLQPKKVAGLYETDQVIHLPAKVESMAKQFEKMCSMMAPEKQVASVFNLCEYCGRNSKICECNLSIDEAKYINYRVGGAYSNNYNPEWRKHPDFSWKDNSNVLNPHQQHHQQPRTQNIEGQAPPQPANNSHLESLLSKFVEGVESRLAAQETFNAQQVSFNADQRAFNKKMETYMAEISQQLAIRPLEALPSQSKKNPGNTDLGFKMHA